MNNIYQVTDMFGDTIDSFNSEEVRDSVLAEYKKSGFPVVKTDKIDYAGHLATTAEFKSLQLQWQRKTE